MNAATCNDIPLLRAYAKALEDEVRTLHRRLGKLTTEIASLKNQDQQTVLELEVKLLQEAVDRRERELFGDSSERRPKDGSPDGESSGSSESSESSESTKPAPPRPPRRGHGPRPQPQLPLVFTRHVLDEPDLVCPECGDLLPEWAGQVEESDEIIVVERQYKILRHQKQKYRCACGHIETALGPPKLIPGGRYSIDFAADVAVDKYQDHLPLNRQVERMARTGLVVDTQTLWDQLSALVRVLNGCYQALVLHVLAAAVLLVDETTWHFFGPGTKRLGRKKGTLWGAVGNGAVFYQLEGSRSAEAAVAVLRGYQGILVVDGYDGYPAMVRAAGQSVRDGPPLLVYCLTHARRKFVQAEPHYPEARRAIELIGKVYEVEAEVDHAEVGSEAERLELRARLRREKSAPLMKELRTWALAQRALPRSSFGRALTYIDERWTGLTHFLEDARIPLDTNAIERLLRGPVLGRKNHLGSQSKRGMAVAGCLYSLLASAKLAGVDPRAYLREAALRALADPKDVLLPHQYRAELDARAAAASPP